MPVNAAMLGRAAKSSLDYYLKNKPIDQIGTERPLLAALMKKKKSFPGAKQYVVEQIRKSYDSNFQWFSGSDEVTYNRKDTLSQAQYAWSSAHDGYAMDEDEMTRNGIIFTDETQAVATGAESIQLTNLLKENNETLRLGFEEKFDLELHRDGTSDPDAIVGLDGLISLAPTTGVVGGIDRALFPYWRNYAQTGINSGVAGNVKNAMETAWRRTSRNGGRPTIIVAGEDWIDAYRKDGLLDIQRFITGGNNRIDASVDGLDFHGIPIVWDPVFADLDALLAPAIPWQKRAYMLNLNYMTLRPAQGHDMITRNPPRVYNRYTQYMGLTWKGALTVSRMNAHAVLSIA